MQKDAFYFFVVEYKRRIEVRAKMRIFRDIEEAASQARQQWLKMTSGQRREYVRQAKEYQKDIECLSKYNTLVRDSSMLETGMCSEANKVRLLQNLIDKRLENAASRWELANQEFCFISMLYFCRTFQDTYLPAELAIVRYSLQCGVKEQLHMLINPGVISLTDEYNAIQHSKETHALPIPPDALGVSDYDEIAGMVLPFVTVHEQPTILFTNAPNVPIVESMLRELLDDHIDANMLYVCSLEELFCKLQQAAAMETCSAASSVELAQQLLTGDAFNDTGNIGCQYHESRYLQMHCALAQCIRWAYTISNNCCTQMHIELIPGKHIPNDKGMDSGAHSPNSGTELAAIENELKAQCSKPVAKPDGVAKPAQKNDWFSKRLRRHEIMQMKLARK